MKKLVLFFIISPLAITCIGQNDTISTENSSDRTSGIKRHEVNVGFTNLFTNRYTFWEEIYYLSYYNGYYYGDVNNTPYFFEGIGLNATRYGIGYKFHFTKSAIRMYGDFGVNSNSNSDDEKNLSGTYPSEIHREFSWESRLVSGRLGYEFVVSSKRADFFFGADVMYQYSNWKYNYKSTSTSTAYYPPYSSTTFRSSESRAKYNATGGGPIIGLRYHLSDMVSISTETRIDIVSFNQKGSGEESSSSSTGTNSSTDSDTFTSKGIRTKVTPLGLFSLNVHL